MNYGICPLSIVPVRSTPSDKSEMVSQLLFGELLEVLEVKNKQWSKVRCHFDNFVGWVATNQIKAITPSEFEAYQSNFAYCLELMQAVMAEHHYLPITLGAQLPNFDGMRFNIENNSYTFSGQAVFPADIESNAEFVLKIARRYLFAPYLWGGRSPMGIDSAGFIQVVFKIAGFVLPRETSEQVFSGKAVDFIEESLPGDIAFFENRSGRITHTGIIMPDHKIIHAYGCVRIDKLDHYGIFDESVSKYTHKLRVIKRILPPASVSNTSPSEQDTTLHQQVELFKS